MRFLLLNQTFFPDVAATAQHLADLALELRRRGHEVTVVTSRRAYDDPSKRFPALEIWQGIEIRRVSGTGFGKGAKWKRALDFGSFYLRCALEVIRLKRFDAVVALTSPPLIAVLGALLCRVKGGRLFYWMMDFNPDEAIAAGWLRAGSVPARILEVFSRFSLRASHRVIALDRFMKDRIVAKGVPPEKVLVVSPWAHTGEIRFDVEGRNRFRSRYGLEDRCVVMYSGNHSPCHPLETLLHAARELNADQTFHFCFVGGGSEHRRVKEFAESEGLRNVTCLPYQPLSDLAGSLSAADVHVVVMGEPMVGLIHPCKIYNVLQVNSPVLVIGPEESHLGDLLNQLKDSRLVARVNHGDVTGVVRELERIRDVGGRDETGLNARIVRNFSDSLLVPELASRMEERVVIELVS